MKRTLELLCYKTKELIGCFQTVAYRGGRDIMQFPGMTKQRKVGISCCAKVCLLSALMAAGMILISVVYTKAIKKLNRSLLNRHECNSF